MSKKLSIIISNRNDTVMLSITVASCIEALRPLGLKNCEIIIVDNSDEPTYKLLNSVLPTGYMREKLLKVHRQTFPCLFSARQLAAEKSLSKYILCLDSHMLVGHNTFTDLYNFMESTNDSKIAFAHAPLRWAHHHESSSVHDRDMSVNELGDWNKSYKSPSLMSWKGMPWICNRNWFLNDLKGYGALAEHKISWGGGDMHIGIKPWLLGYRNWAVPTNPCIHIGPFPKIDQSKNPNNTKIGGYRLYGSSGSYPHTFGFLVSCYVLGGEEMMARNEEAITARFGRYINVKEWWDKAIELGQEEREWLVARQKLTFNELLATMPWKN